ncbi:hypothetical protein ACKI1J_30545 [Streptomyces scabiei]|uniref:hypothetical protein n=1 Tax=Streptomyces scabiei TaxID=1930 RepID=UPI0038F7B0B2
MDLEELLPPPAKVRCVLAQDVELRLHALFDLMNLPIESDLVDQVLSFRDDRFLRKLRAIVPAEDLQRVTRQGHIDLDEAIASRPYLVTVYIMETARTLEEIQRGLPQNAKAQGSGE